MSQLVIKDSQLQSELTILACRLFYYPLLAKKDIDIAIWFYEYLFTLFGQLYRVSEELQMELLNQMQPVIAMLKDDLFR